MRGFFEFVGEQGFPFDKSVRCSAHVWHCPPEFGDFSMRFICPIEEAPRRFFIQDFVEDIQRASPSTFVDDACLCGSRILAEIETALGVAPSEEKLWAALFRNRRAGHTWVSRRFDDVSDFVKYDPVSNRAALLIPGALADDTKIRRTGMEGYGRRKEDAHSLLRSCLPEKKQFYSDGDVIAFLQEKIAAQGAVPLVAETPLASLPLDMYMHRGPIDSLLMNGVRDGGKAAEFFDLCVKVGGAFINELSLRSDTQTANARQEEYGQFVDRLGEKAESKSPTEFDKWLKNEREHGFVRLLGRKRSSTSKSRQPEAGEVGKTFYRLTLWLAYEMMSRCFGALMLVAFVDFCCDERLRPNEEEGLLFRQMHAPQYYLGGLPVAFVGPSQLRFIAKPLLFELWTPAKLLQPEAYLPLADMLSCYAFLNSERRLADRDQKEDAPRVPKTDFQDGRGDSVPPEEMELDAIESLPMRSSLDCPTCGHALQLDKALGVPKDDIIALHLYCSECDNFHDCRVSLPWLQSLAPKA